MICENEDLPERIPVPSTCRECSKPFTGYGWRPMSDSSKVVCFDRYCEVCEPIANARQKAEEQAAELRSQRDAWSAICPVEMRTIAEGGNTDLERLKREQPLAEGLLSYPYSARGLILRGNTGTAKTRVMYRVMRGFFELGKSIKILSAGEFDREARDAQGRFELTSWFNSLAKVSALFIDDLGKGAWTKSTCGQFFELVDNRYKNAKPIYITTNVNSETLLKTLEMDRDIGEPALRRLKDTTEQMIFRKT